MSRLKLLDLFCGQGGASTGYHMAGFDVLGVDLAKIRKRSGELVTNTALLKRYPFPMVQADALEFLDSTDLSAFDAIHASPPCQLYSVANNIHGRTDHPDLIEPVRERLIASGLPYVIENVPGAPLRDHFTLCGLSFGLGVKRHRLFESNVFMMVPPCGDHRGDWLLVFGHTVLTRGKVVGKAKGGGNTIRRQHVGTDRGRAAMGIGWMTRDGLSEAIPPAFTEFIGARLLEHLSSEAAA